MVIAGFKPSSGGTNRDFTVIYTTDRSVVQLSSSIKLIASHQSKAIMTTSARDRILDTATQLFCSQGIRAIGVDTIISESGVAKTTLYHHFESKDDLIVAFLRDIDKLFWQWWERAVRKHPNNPRQQILELFRALAKKVSSPKYRGCPFINTL